MVVLTSRPLCLMFCRSFERGSYQIPVYLDGHLWATVHNKAQGQVVSAGRGSLESNTASTLEIDRRCTTKPEPRANLP